MSSRVAGRRAAARPTRPLRNPGIKYPDVQKLLAAQWNAMPLHQRQPYIDKAQEALKVYRAQMMVYVPPPPSFSYSIPGPTTTSDRPRRPQSSFLMYANEQRARVRASREGITHPQMMKVLAAEWGEFTVQQKKQWVDKANAAKRKYQTDKESWQAAVSLLPVPAAQCVPSSHPPRRRPMLLLPATRHPPPTVKIQTLQRRAVRRSSKRRCTARRRRCSVRCTKPPPPASRLAP